MVLFARLSVVDGGRFSLDDDHRRQPQLVVLCVSAVYRGWLLVAPIAVPTIAADLFHGKSFGAIIGAISLFIGAGAGIGPWLGGVIHDWTGSYREAFWIAQALTFVSVIFIWVAESRNHK